jgi:protocatechuate 3,4-dioxygenase beta subunit
MPELAATPGQTIGPFFHYALPYPGDRELAPRGSAGSVEPGPARPGGAPFFAVVVFARGLLNRLFTRIYLPAGYAVLDADPLLSTLDAVQRSRMVAVREADGSLRSSAASSPRPGWTFSNFRN